MAKIDIDKDKCKACFLCVSFCPKGLLKQSRKLNRKGVPSVEYAENGAGCLGCAMCAVICPDCCIEVYK